METERDLHTEFFVALWRELKRVAVEPVLSMGEILAFTAFLAFKPSPWIYAPVLFVWLVLRNRRPTP